MHVGRDEAGAAALKPSKALRSAAERLHLEHLFGPQPKLGGRVAVAAISSEHNASGVLFSFFSDRYKYKYKYK